MKSNNSVPQRRPNAKKKPIVLPSQRATLLEVVFEREEADRYRKQVQDLLKTELILNQCALRLRESTELGYIKGCSPNRAELEDLYESSRELLAKVRTELREKTIQVRLIEERELPERGQ